MENLNDNQKLVLKFLTNNAKETFNMTQVGVQAGKKIPKSASTWSKPILESLVKLKLVSKIEKEGKTTFQILEKKSSDKKEETKKVENVKEEKTIPIQKTIKEKIEKEPKKKDDKPVKEKVIKKNLLTDIDRDSFLSKLEDEAAKFSLEETKNKKVRTLTEISKKILLSLGLEEKSLKANTIKGFIFKCVKHALGEDYETREDGRSFEIGEIVKFSGGKTLDKDGQGEIISIKFNTHGHRYMRLRIEGGLVIDKTDKFLIKL